MKNIYLFLLSIILLSRNEKQEQEASVFEYYDNINLAKEAILYKQFEKADSLYALAISSEYSIAKDKFAGLGLSAKLSNKSQFLERYKLFLMDGGAFNYLEKDSLLNRYLREQNLPFLDSLKSLNQKYCETHLGSINLNLRDKLLGLSHKDNKWKVHYIDSLVRVDATNQSIYENEYAAIVNAIVEDELFPYIEKYGYPGEKLTGIDGSICYGNNATSLFNNYAKVILLHYYSNFGVTLNSKEKLNYQISLLKGEVLKGNLSNNLYASIVDFINKYVEKQFIPKSLGYYNEWHSSKDTTAQNIQAINERRSAIGLMDLELKAELRQRGLDICKEKKEGNHEVIRLFDWCG